LSAFLHCISSAESAKNAFEVLISRLKWKCSLIGIIVDGQSPGGFLEMSLSQDFISDESSMTLPCCTSRQPLPFLPLMLQPSKEKPVFFNYIDQQRPLQVGKKVHHRLIMNAIKNPSNLNKLTLGHCQ
jgi:hypothetical protein